MLVDDAIERELELLGSLQGSLQGGPVAVEPGQAVAEMAYLMVSSKFGYAGFPLVDSLQRGGLIYLSTLDVKVITEKIYSPEALEMVKDHLTKSIVPVKSDPRATLDWSASLYYNTQITLPLFNAGQIYSVSLLFGHFLRRAEKRFKLEKMMSDSTGSQTLRKYMESMTPDQVAEARALALEVQHVIELQMVALFGDMELLKLQVFKALGPPDPLATEADLSAKLEAALRRGDVMSVRLTTGDLRRLLVEAVVFGSFLQDVEGLVESHYELTTSPSFSLGLRRVLGIDDAGEVMFE